MNPNPTKSRRLARTIGRGLLVGFIAGALLFIGLETVLRILPPRYWRLADQSPDRIIAFRKDKILLHTHIPGATGFNTNVPREFEIHYRVNSHGLRDVEHTWNKPPGTFRILVVGDSFPEGLQVELDQIFPRLLQKLLERSGRAKRIEVINTGVSGYSPLIVYLYLKTNGFRYKPDLVVLSYIQKYLDRDTRYRRWARFDTQGLPLACPHPAGQTRIEWLKFLYQKIRSLSRAVLFLDERIKKILRGKKVDPTEFHLRPGVWAERDWTFMFKMLLGIRDLCRRQGAKLALVFIPRASQVRGEDKRRRYPSDYTDDGPQRRMASFARRNGIPLLDLLPAFNASVKHPLYFPIDGHLTPAGHELVARRLARFLIQHHLVPH